MSRYSLEFTKRKYDGHHKKLFKTKKSLQEFLRKNKKKIYWNRIRKLNNISSKPLPVAGFIPDLGYTKMKGHLTTHFETGLECMGLVFIDNKKTGYDALHFIRHGDILEVEGVKIGMLNDLKMAADDGYVYSFYPQGFALKHWINLFNSQTKAILYKRNRG